jgi:hypothetical protein
MLLVLVLMLLAAPALRVYYQVTVYDVRVVRMDANGARTPLPTPRTLARPSRLAIYGAAYVLPELERRIARVMQHDSTFMSGPASSFEWTINWSENSTRVDSTRVLLLTGGLGVAR